LKGGGVSHVEPPRLICYDPPMSLTSMFRIGAGMVLSLIASVTCSAQGAPELKVGDPAPAFSLPGSDGKTHSLADYKGKAVVLAWFPKAFTGG
jgi:peroxiredoxin Q/BCP